MVLGGGHSGRGGLLIADAAKQRARIDERARPAGTGKRIAPERLPDFPLWEGRPAATAAGPIRAMAEMLENDGKCGLKMPCGRGGRQALTDSRRQAAHAV